MSRVRLRPEHREAKILNAAWEIAKSEGLYDITLVKAGEGAGCTHSTVSHYFKSTIGLREAVIKKALEDNDLQIIGQAVVNMEPIITDIDPAKKKEALLFLANFSQ